MSRICYHCGEKNSEKSSFCKYCGSKLYEFRYNYRCWKCNSCVDWLASKCIRCGGDAIKCPNCSRSVSSGHSKCTHCGFELSNSPTGLYEYLYKLRTWVGKNDKRIIYGLLISYFVALLAFMYFITNT